ncbi:MAG: dienelactone hydrolase family protein [Kiritimatiellae bacterium]|nr:dienelactone hydrolase family protein [Kiritimatiellia bacterium]
MKRFPLLFALAAFALAANAATAIRSNTPASRLDGWWTARHAEKVAAVGDSSVKKDVVFLGDELVQDWETTGAGALATYFAGDRTMFNLGFAGDCTENVLWRIRNGELGSPKVVFLMVGGNNAAIYTEKEEPEGKTYLGVREIIDDLVASVGASKVVVQAVLPRGLDESDPVRPRNDRLNIDVRAYAQKKGCAWVDLSDLFLESDHHTLKTSLFNADRVTLNAAGYEVWAQAVAPYVAAATGGSAMPADLVATARPEIDRIATFPTAVNADLQDAFWRKFEDDLKLIGENGRSFDLVLLGDSLTQKWMEGNSASSMNGLAASVLNLGRTGDFVENLLWRLESGCIDGYTTKFFNLLIGTNNTIGKNPSEDPADIAAGVRAVLDLVLAKHPESKVLLMPIIPYGYTNAQNGAKGAAHYANNEAANEIIRTFADGQRVILVDVRSQFLNADGTYRGEMYLQGNGDYPDQFLHLTTKAYEEILAPAIANAMAAAGASSVMLPTIGSAAAQVSGTSATIALSNVTKGTDASGAAAASFTVSYKLDAGAETALPAAETGSAASFELADLADGWHTCAVWVSSDGVVTSAVKRVKFQIDSQADAVGWKVAPMDATGSAFRSDGTQVFARGFTGHTVNGISFSAGFPGSDQATVSPSSYTGAGWTENNPVFNGGWVWEKSDSSLDLAFTLKGLTAGKKYLVQILAANHWNNSSTTLSAGDLVPFEATKQNDYKCGAVISRVFEASGSEETVTVTFATSGSKCLVKAIQLRELGDGGGGGGGDDLTGEFVKKTFVASNKLQLPYRVAAKADPNGGKVPVVVFLHGYGQCGVDNSFTINEMSNIQRYLDGAGGPSGYKLLVPQCPNDVKWAEFSMNSTTCTFQDKPSAALQAVFDLLDAYAAMADVDADRIYVTGLSMGGHGTWDAICRRPDFFAAAMPCCGGGDPACAADIAHVPVLAVHNRGDPTIPVEQTEGIVTALRALGSDVIFEKLENNSHDAWTTCYATEDDVTAGAPNHRFVWMFAQNRATNNRPKYPRIAELAAAPSGSNATISLTGVVLGTDANSVSATKYSVAYKLDGAAAVTALSDQTADCSFTLEGLADGNHACEVTMTTDKGRAKTKSVVFYVNTSAVSDVWTSGYMDAGGTAFSTEGTFVYGYVCNGGTINGIPFERSVNLQSSENPPKISFTPNIDGFTGDFMNESVGGNLGLSLGNGWYWDGDGSGTHTVTLTLSNLEGGKIYLVQFLAHNYWNNTTTVSANGCDPVHIHGDNEASGKYGALVTGVFTAVGATKDVTITYQGGSGKMPFNAVQVRELDGAGGGGGGGGATVVEPSIGSVTATPSGSTASLFLSGIVMGTDDAGTDATSYSVSYALNGGTPVTALQNQSAATASFSIADLADGDYTCAVTIATDKGKTASKTVSFTIGAAPPPPPPPTGWTVETLSASDATMLRTDGTPLYAYRGASTARTLGDVTFQSGADLSSANISFDPAFVAAGVNAGSSSLLGEAWDFGVETSMAEIRLTLRGLTAGHKYLVQILARNSYGNAYITVGDLTPVSIQNGNGSSGATVYGSFTAEGTSHVVVFKMGGSGARRYVSAVQVRDLGAAGPPAPVIGGGDGGEAPFAVGEDSVSIVIANAVAGCTYVFKKSPTLDGLAAASVDPRTFTATSNGVLRIVIPIEAGEESSCFYRFGVQ